jgi:hypothetical protein
MNVVRAFARFLYDFVVGDDWRLAVAAAAALGLSAAAVGASIAGWWVAPVVITAALALVVLRDQT